jgi:hypothetical protein
MNLWLIEVENFSFEVFRIIGFLECLDTLFKLHCPKGRVGEEPYSVEDANYSRKVTRFRNIVERVFGRLKQWKLIAGMILV